MDVELRALTPAEVEPAFAALERAFGGARQPVAGVTLGSLDGAPWCPQVF